MALKDKKGRKSHTPIHYLLEQGIVKVEDFHNMYKSDGAVATAEHYGISTGTLYGVLKQYKLSAGTKRVILNKMDEGTRKKLVEELRHDAARSVAKKHGLSYQTVCKLAKQHGVRLHRMVPWDFSQASRMLTELQKSSVETVANRHGFPVEKVLKLAKYVGMDLPRKRS
jgi:transposase-like protein